MAGYSTHCQVKLLDLASDEEDIRFQEITRDTILIVEGVFLFRPEIFRFLHVKLFIEVSFENVLQRVLLRDVATLITEAKIRERYEKKYIPGQMLYLNEVAPRSIADAVIDNNNFENPRLYIQGKPH